VSDPSAAIVLLLHGPNLNLLGEREPHVYGTATLADHVAVAEQRAACFGLAIEAFQSNHEGDLIDAIHRARLRCAAIVINPGAFTHYAWGLHDALAAFGGPIVELHISNPNAREPWRHVSVVAPVATGSIVGFGIRGYALAIEAVAGALGRTADHEHDAAQEPA
jgi:3-dehydroquinate dehydratase-2